MLQIVSGVHGDNGNLVLSLVVMDHKKERGLKSLMPKMVERNVLAITGKQDLVKSENVQVRKNKPTYLSIYLDILVLAVTMVFSVEKWQTLSFDIN